MMSISPEIQYATLVALSRMLRTEADTLAQQPELMWQKLYNRLQWEDGIDKGLLEEERIRRSIPNSLPWLHEVLPVTQGDVIQFTHQVILPTRRYQDRAESHTWRGRVEQCVYNHDNTMLAIMGGGVITIVKTESGMLLQQLQLKRYTGGYACAFSTDDSQFLIVTAGRSEERERQLFMEVLIHETERWELQQAHRVNKTEDWRTFKAAAFSADGKIAVLLMDDQFIVWDLTSEHPGTVIQLNEEVTFVGCMFDPRGRYFLTYDRVDLYFWDIATWQVARKYRLGGMTHEINECFIFEDNKVIVTLTSHAVVELWQLESHDRLQVLQHIPHYLHIQTGVLACAISHDNRLVASCGVDLLVKLWDWKTGEILAVFSGHENMIRTCTFSSDDSYLLTGDDNGKVYVWDTKIRMTDEEIENISQQFAQENYSYGTRTCAISPNAAYFVTAGGDKTATIWNIDGRLQQFLSGHKNDTQACAISPDSRLIMTGDEQGSLYIWDAANGQPITRLVTEQNTPTWSVFDGAFSPDGTWLIATNQKNIERWDLHKWAWQQTYKGPSENIRTCAIRPDGSQIVAGSIDHMLTVWDAGTGTLIERCEGHQDTITHSAFSPDGRYCVTSESGWNYLSSSSHEHDSPIERSIILWNTATWEPQATFHWYATYIIACCITPDGKSIIAADFDGTVKVWNIASGEEQLTYITTKWTLFCLIMHPWRPQILYGGEGNTKMLADLIGLTYGPIIVTAGDDSKNLSVCCPKCHHLISVTSSQLGQELACSQCSLPLHINLFTIDISQPIIIPAPAPEPEPISLAVPEISVKGRDTLAALVSVGCLAVLISSLCALVYFGLTHTPKIFLIPTLSLLVILLGLGSLVRLLRLRASQKKV